MHQCKDAGIGIYIFFNEPIFEGIVSIESLSGADAGILESGGVPPDVNIEGAEENEMVSLRRSPKLHEKGKSPNKCQISVFLASGIKIQGLIVSRDANLLPNGGNPLFCTKILTPEIRLNPRR